MDEKRDTSRLARDFETHSRAAAESMIELTRAVVLSGIGAAGLAMDEAMAFLEKLVERGQIAEKDARQVMDELVQRSRSQAQAARGDTERQVSESLHRLGVPSRSDLTELSAKVALLSAKMDELLASRAEQPAPGAGPVLPADVDNP